MRIRHLRLFPLAIPLRVSFSQANSHSRRSGSVVVAVDTTEGVTGYGEACPRPYVTGEDMASVCRDLVQAGPWLAGQELGSLAAIEALLCEGVGERLGPAAACALELALLDALGKTQGISLFAALQAHPLPVATYTGVLPLAPPAQLDRLLDRIEPLGFTTLKLKASADLADTRARIAAVRARLGPGIPLRLDLNEAWTPDQARAAVPILRAAGITTFEQPLPRGQEAAMAPLMAELGQDVQFMADESVTSLASAQAARDGGWFHAFNLKLSKQGGLFRSRRLYALAQAAGIRCQLGAHFGETALLTAAGLIFAAMVPALTALEGGLGSLLLQEDISRRPLQLGTGGQIVQPAQQLAGPGLGVEVDEAVLERYRWEEINTTPET